MQGKESTKHAGNQGAQTNEEESGGSVTHWIASLREGDSNAAQQLWDRYFRKLVDLAHSRFPLLRNAGNLADEEDAALSALNVICTGLVHGRHPDLSDRDDLWRFLVVITARKAINQIQGLTRQKRGCGTSVHESDLETSEVQPFGLDHFVGPDPTPEFIAQMNEECQVLMGLLSDDPELKLSEIAIWKLEGFTSQEISAKLQCSVRTVASRLKLIRKSWETHV